MFSLTSSEYASFPCRERFGLVLLQHGTLDYGDGVPTDSAVRFLIMVLGIVFAPVQDGLLNSRLRAECTLACVSDAAVSAHPLATMSSLRVVRV